MKSIAQFGGAVNLLSSKMRTFPQLIEYAFLSRKIGPLPTNFTRVDKRPIH